MFFLVDVYVLTLSDIITIYCQPNKNRATLDRATFRFKRLWISDNLKFRIQIVEK
jgi:hypothetical protein